MLVLLLCSCSPACNFVLVLVPNPSRANRRRAGLTPRRPPPDLAEILEVDHIDVFHVAFADLAQSMGYLHDLGNPKVRKQAQGMETQPSRSSRCRAGHWRCPARLLEPLLPPPRTEPA